MEGAFLEGKLLFYSKVCSKHIPLNMYLCAIKIKFGLMCFGLEQLHNIYPFKVITKNPKLTP